MKPEVESDYVRRKKDEINQIQRHDDALVNFQHIKRLRRELEEEEIKLQ